ncbi:PAS domain-containing sensor histidine kinase [Thioclava sp. SK-1]|uniref:sensor histidine kinase NtrY-like n=1 Tax=Thioclava sp. SK-1 TaxID=1889770 RepID=UPI000825BC00|nr:PAS domain-containing sensor histidine kinase [Thioclava sp. SK-1]
MGSATHSKAWDRLARLRRQRRYRNVVTLGLVVLGPALAVCTFFVLGPMGQGADSNALRFVLLADFVYFLLLAGLIVMRLAQVLAARRKRSAGSRLTLRLTGIFAFIALVPTILVALFAGLTVNIGLEGWFSDRVREVVGTSLQAAEAYQDEHRHDLIQDADALAGFLNIRRQAATFMSDGELRELLVSGQSGIQRGLKEAYVIDGTGEIIARGERSYLFDFEKPAAEDIVQAQRGGTIAIEDWDIDEFHALKRLDAFVDRYLYVSRTVDGSILSLLDDTRETVNLYQQLEQTRGRVIFEFGLVYLGFALIMILAAVWLGLWFAERLSRPIGQMAEAAVRVGGGDFTAHVREEAGEDRDEIAQLGRSFNKMTQQLKEQREALLASHDVTEERRRLFDSVLSSVTSGVMGLDAEGRLDFVNRSAMRLLEIDDQGDYQRNLAQAVPEFSTLFNKLHGSVHEVLQEEIRVSRHGKLESLLVRIAVRRADDGHPEGYVIAFEDVTELVSAQRMAAWGDVARRIAHEIKNPLTPIQLSAERIKRKFRKTAGDDEAVLEQLTGVIIRQTNDLRRIIDEFSKFARMPEPDRRNHDLAALMRDIVALQEGALHGATIEADVSATPVIVELDATMIGQALTNLVKNAGEAIETLAEKGAPEGYEPRVRVMMEDAPEQVTIRITDNGVGLPEDRSRLFEPYVTTRSKGTGLGLPIVKKIIEEHGGTLVLTDAPPFEPGAHSGAMAEIRLPRARAALRAIKDREET